MPRFAIQKTCKLG